MSSVGHSSLPVRLAHIPLMPTLVSGWSCASNWQGQRSSEAAGLLHQALLQHVPVDGRHALPAR